MIVSNVEGLSSEELKKTLHPYAQNTGVRPDLRAAGKAAAEYIEENADLLVKTGELLDKAQY